MPFFCTCNFLGQRSSFPPLSASEIKQEQPDYPSAIGFSGGGLQNYFNPNQQQVQSPVHPGQSGQSPIHVAQHMHQGSPMHVQSPIHPGHQSPLHPGMGGHQSPNPYQQQHIMQHQPSSPYHNQGGMQNARQLQHHNLQSTSTEASQLRPSSQPYQPSASPLHIHNLQPANSIQQQQGQGAEQNNQDQNRNNNDENNTDDFANISLPNLSDVNLSLLENHLSENFNSNLVLIDPDVQVIY